MAEKQRIRRVFGRRESVQPAAPVEVNAPEAPFQSVDARTPSADHSSAEPPGRSEVPVTVDSEPPTPPFRPKDPFAGIVAMVTPWLEQGEVIWSRTSPTIGRGDDPGGVRSVLRCSTNHGRSFTLDGNRFTRMGNLPAHIAEEVLEAGEWKPALEPRGGAPLTDE